MRGGGTKKNINSLKKATKSVNTIKKMFENVPGAKGESPKKTNKIENLKKYFEGNSEPQQITVLKKGEVKCGKKMTKIGGLSQDKKITAYFQPKTDATKKCPSIETESQLTAHQRIRRRADRCAEEISPTTGNRKYF